MREIKIELRDQWLILDVKGDQMISYPVYGDGIEKKVDKFARDLKKALKGERLSDLC